MDLILDSEINPMLLSSFVGALSLFGSESLGKIEEITIKGLSIQMVIVNKFDLVLIAIMDKDFAKEDMREEAEKALDMFYHLYKNEISDSTDVSQFESFKKILYDQIVEYFNRVNGENTKKQIRDFGFFTEAIAKSRN
ncbi:MAG: hypothetical protein KGD72_06100 [Candidatus Lokiarchaeota archaeon]|nr:hypothetical protein [Candidatus Lokiarchaeota archaeon]